jgi:hypothetical protein
MAVATTRALRRLVVLMLVVELFTFLLLGRVDC